MARDFEVMARAARAAEARPFYLASAFAAFRHETGATDAEIAETLAVDIGVDGLPRLALCRRPRDLEDVAVIATVFEIDAGALARICGLG